MREQVHSAAGSFPPPSYNQVVSPVLTTEQAAEYLCLSPWKIRQLVKNGELPYIGDCGKWRFLKSDLDEYLLKHRTVM